MLSRDERVRPDWVDLEEHVMKTGDEGKKSFIHDDRKRSSGDLIGHLARPSADNSFPNNNTFIRDNRPSKSPL